MGINEHSPPTSPMRVGPPIALAVGEPGASLQREYDRRATLRARRVRAEHPLLGRLIVTLTDEPRSTRAYKVGATGERRAATKVAALAGPDVRFLFNRCSGAGGRADDIDMLAVGPAGVYVVDVKRSRGDAVAVRRTYSFGARREQLFIAEGAGADMLTSLRHQVLTVRAALEAHPYGEDIPVISALCFIDAKRPLAGQRLADVPLLGVRGTAGLVSSAGVLGATDRAEIQAVLADGLPPAQ